MRMRSPHTAKLFAHGQGACQGRWEGGLKYTTARCRSGAGAASAGAPPPAGKGAAGPPARQPCQPVLTRAADAAVVHLEHLLFGLDHKTVVHTHLRLSEEGRGAGGQGEGRGISE